MSVTIRAYRNAKSIKADNTILDVEINHPVHGWIPYTLDETDTDNTVNNNDLKTLIGSDFTAYAAPTDAKKAADIRNIRASVLEYEVDPVVSNPLLWSDIGTSKQNEWLAYRTALLNISAQEAFPDSVSWPTKPS